MFEDKEKIKKWIEEEMEMSIWQEGNNLKWLESIKTKDVLWMLLSHLGLEPYIESEKVKFRKKKKKK